MHQAIRWGQKEVISVFLFLQNSVFGLFVGAPSNCRWSVRSGCGSRTCIMCNVLKLDSHGLGDCLVGCWFVGWSIGYYLVVCLFVGWSIGYYLVGCWCLDWLVNQFHLVGLLLGWLLVVCRLVVLLLVKWF